MKILHVFKTYLPDDFTGIPRVIHAIAQGLADKGVESHVLAVSELAGKEPLLIDRHIVHQARLDLHVASTSFSREAFSKFRELVRQVDIIHYQFPWPMADLLHLAYGRSKPAVVSYQSDIVKQRVLRHLYAPLMHRFLGSVHRIVAASPNYCETSAVLRRYKDKVSVIPIGLPERDPPDENRVVRWRAEVGEEFFLFVGALRYYKGIGYLIEAARQSGVHVVIAGGNELGEMDVSTLPSNVMYVGKISDADKEALLDLCSAFVFPSHLRSEAFGVALAEAARAGKPMVSCEIGTGTSFVNKDGETGIVVPPADAAALAEAMKALADEPDRAARLGENAHARYESLFRVDKMADSYLQLYREVLKER